MKRVALLVFSLIATTPTFAGGGASDWAEGFGYKARLIEGKRDSDGSYQAGLQISLEEGWKTYWRMPGENGIPPDFKFGASENLQNAEVHWPAPILFQDIYGTSVGYQNDVVLPITIKSETDQTPVTLNLQAFFGVCAEVCVPAQVDLEVALDSDATQKTKSYMIDDALTKVPSTDSRTDFAVTSAEIKEHDVDERIALSIKVPTDVSRLTILTEGPEDWFVDPFEVDLNENAKDQAGELDIDLPLYRLIKEPLLGDEKLRITLVSEKTSVETTVRLN
ncbi:MAG: protein-disulfide reductase DsbD domain-containing protein [Pseudomonadota bacterium]